ncbi:MAG: glycosyltransferase [Vicinamibacterales bacterium]|nr:glycosyltransferase [Vicinamibacterales bacterium]
MPALTVVVVVYNIPREAPRTLFSLSADYQRDIDPEEYEIIVVDNGSSPPFDPRVLDGLQGNFRLLRIDDAPASPAHAANRGLAAARGAVVGLLIDGARLVTPGLLHYALLGANSHPKAVVASLGWYLGGDLQGAAAEAGYNQAREDALLSSIDWPTDGYRLFDIGTLDESSVDGWMAPISETNTLFMRRQLWDLLGGLDERFDAAGGGLVNLDIYRRALQLDGADPVVLLGEASFHQLHGGVSTNAGQSQQLDNWDRWHSQYRQLRSVDWTWVPRRSPATLIGRLPAEAMSRFVHSAISPVRADVHPLGPAFDQGTWSPTPVARPADPVTAGLVDLAHMELRRGRPGAAGAVARFARHRDPDNHELRRLMSLTANHVRFEPDDAHRAVALARAHQIVGDLAGATAHFRKALDRQPGLVDAHVGLSELRMPAEHYLVWLQRLYDLLAPATALEIGIYHGQSLALHRPPTVVIGVDPQPLVAQPLQTETHIFTQTSDAFFASQRLDALLGGRPLSVGFIDGLHLFEQALRDFMNLEAHCGPESTILIHDTVPLDEPTQRREMDTVFHTGDVWRTVLCLRKYRPGLQMFTIATPPTGLTVVTGLDPSSRLLEAHYDEYVNEFLSIPFVAIENDLSRALNVVAADLPSVERLLGERRSTRS